MQGVEGLKFHHLTVLKRLPRDSTLKSRASRVLARCDCGSERPYFLALIKGGNTKSCGCPGLDPRRTGLDVHVRENGIWRNLKQRCLNPKSPHYANFGGRGITLCDRWITFKNFLDDMGACPEGMGLGRHNHDAGYTKENCVWKTRKELAQERRQSAKTPAS